MRLLAHTSVSVLFSLLLTPVCAAAQSAVPAAAQGFSVDSRLQQKVAVHAEGIPVSDLLVLLGRKTGVSLKADPYVADDKVAAFSPARSLRSTLLDLAALFNDTWEEAPLADGQLRKPGSVAPARAQKSLSAHREAEYISPACLEIRPGSRQKYQMDRPP